MSNSNKKKKKTRSNRKAFYLPFLIVVLLLVIIIMNNIHQETKLPSENWSRSINSTADSISAEPIIYKKDKQYVIHTLQKDGIQTTTLNQNLKQVDQKVIHLPIDTRVKLWTNGEETAFISNGDLVLYKGSKKFVLDSKVGQLGVAKDRFAYTKGKDVYVYDPQNEKKELIYTAQEGIQELSGHPESNSFIAHIGDKIDMQTIFLKESDSKYKVTQVLNYVKTATDKLYNFRFAEDEDNVHFIYTYYTTKQESKSFQTYYGSAPIDQLNKVTFKMVRFFDPSNGVEIKNSKYVQLNVRDGKPTMLFGATGPVSMKEEAGNIYLANSINGKWMAKRISTTNDFSIYPVKADERTIFWLKARSVTDYEVFAASQNPSIIKDSQSVRKNDVYSAVFDAFSASIISFIAMTNAVIWIIPTLLFMGILYIVRIQFIEDERSWVKWTSILLFIITQVYVIQSLFNSMFYRLAPNYLTFKGSSFILPIIVSIFALYVMQAVKNKEWGMFAQISYFMGTTILFQLFIVGMYVY